MATAAEPRAAALPLPGGRAEATVRVHPLLTATTMAPPGYLRLEQGRLAKLRAIGVGVPKDRWVPVPIPAFLVEHPGAGPLLIDTGFHGSVAVDAKQNLGRMNARIFGSLKMEASDAAAAQVRARGIDPAEVGTVVMTHLHVDHASAIVDFPQATFVVDRREWSAATARAASMSGYVNGQIDHAFDYRLIDFDAPEVGSHASFGRAIDLFGDGSVRLLSTPGHTPGHLSVLLRTGARDVLVAGDAIFTTATLRDGNRPLILADEHRFRRSLRELQLFTQQAPDALVIPGHDMDAWRALEPVYP